MKVTVLVRPGTSIHWLLCMRTTPAIKTIAVTKVIIVTTTRSTVVLRIFIQSVRMGASLEKLVGHVIVHKPSTISTTKRWIFILASLQAWSIPPWRWKMVIPSKMHLLLHYQDPLSSSTIKVLYKLKDHGATVTPKLLAFVVFFILPKSPTSSHSLQQRDRGTFQKLGFCIDNSLCVCVWVILNLTFITSLLAGL